MYNADADADVDAGGDADVGENFDDFLHSSQCHLYAQLSRGYQETLMSSNLLPTWLIIT